MARLTALAALRIGGVAVTSPALRPYQEEAVKRIRAAYEDRARRILFQLPTGGGKTIVFSYILAGAAQRGRRVLVLTHRQEIADQVEAPLTMADVAYGKIAAGIAESDETVQLASVATLARAKRLERWRGWADLVVVDEAHHCVAGSWASVLVSQGGAKILGVTATPERLDGRGLGEIFDHMVVGPQVAELTKAGFLSPATVFEPIAGGPDMSGAKIRAGDYAVEDLRQAMDGVVIGAAVDEYVRICPGVPAVAFCIDVAHSRAVAQRFNEADIAAAHVDGDSSPADRRAAIAALGSGDLKVLTNCGLISEGVDVPSIGAAILLKPTASLALYMQQVGRALRPSPGKTRALVLDFSGNCARHGLPDAQRAWSLDSKPTTKRERGDGPGLRHCKACRVLNRAGARQCANCGTDLRTRREREEIELRLRQAREREDADLVRSLPYADRLLWAGGDPHRLGFVERVCNYKSGWAWHRAREIAARQQGARANG
jgi:DNA repair protein RadD